MKINWSTWSFALSILGWILFLFTAFYFDSSDALRLNLLKMDLVFAVFMIFFSLIGFKDMKGLKSVLSSFLSLGFILSLVVTISFILFIGGLLN